MASTWRRLAAPTRPRRERTRGRIRQHRRRILPRQQRRQPVDNELVQLLARYRQTDDWKAYERRLQRQREFIATHFQTTFSDSALEQLRQALVDVKPCRTCDRKTCPKSAGKFMFVASVDYWNEQIAQRRVADCRTTTVPVPSWQDFDEQIQRQKLNAEAETQANRSHLGLTTLSDVLMASTAQSSA